MQQRITNIRNVLTFTIIIFIIVYAVTLSLDICSYSDIIITVIKSKYIFLDFDLQNNTDSLVGVYGIVWSLSIGIILFVIQNGYGKILGLRMGDILQLVFGKEKTIVFVICFISKFIIYVIAALYQFKLLLFCGILECFYSFGVIVISFIYLPHLAVVGYLLDENIDRFVDSLKKEKQMKNVKLKLIKCSCNMDYNNSAEYDYLEMLVFKFLYRIENLEYDSDIIEKIIIEELAQLKILFENVCFVDGGKKRCEIILKTCASKLALDGAVDNNQISFKLYLLFKTLFDSSSITITPDFIQEVAAILKPEIALPFINYLLSYFICLDDYSIKSDSIQYYPKLFTLHQMYLQQYTLAELADKRESEQKIEHKTIVEEECFNKCKAYYLEMKCRKNYIKSKENIASIYTKYNASFESKRRRYQ